MSSGKEEKDPQNVELLSGHWFHTRVSVQMVVKGHVVPAWVRKVGSRSNCFHLSTSDLLDLHTKVGEARGGIHPCTCYTHKHTHTQADVCFFFGGGGELPAERNFQPFLPWKRHFHLHSLSTVWISDSINVTFLLAWFPVILQGGQSGEVKGAINYICSSLKKLFTGHNRTLSGACY